MSALVFDKVSKRFEGGRLVLDAVTLEVPAGARYAIVGRSGSGKSTLLHIAAGIEVPTTGTVRLFSKALHELDDRGRTLLRRDNVGLVFQFFHLLSHLTVEENVALPAMIAGTMSAAMRERILRLLARVGLADRARDSAQKLSGGEMQRLAICRALLLSPKLILADEPTGNLDDATGRDVMQLLLGASRDEGATLVYVTHSQELAALADARFVLHSGVLETAA
ncbi:MAG: ABC transporter ATP-binding protein [Myxococcota bacterium]